MSIRISKLLCIMKKELLSYFKSPVAYATGTVFLCLCGFLFYNIVKDFSLQSLKLVMLQRTVPEINLHDVIFRPTFHNITVILLLVVPLLTMNLFAGEHKGQTMELLLTSPVSVTEILLGKFFGTLTVLCLLLFLTVPMPLVLSLYKEIDWAAQGSGYIGLFLTGGLFVSIGMLTSSFTKNQFIAAIFSLGFLLLFWMIGFITIGFDNTWLREFFDYISFFNHVENFQKGLVNSSDVIYYLSFTTFALFLTHRVVDSHRWK